MEPPVLLSSVPSSPFSPSGVLLGEWPLSSAADIDDVSVLDEATVAAATAAASWPPPSPSASLVDAVDAAPVSSPASGAGGVGDVFAVMLGAGFPTVGVPPPLHPLRTNASPNPGPPPARPATSTTTPLPQARVNPAALSLVQPNVSAPRGGSKSSSPPSAATATASGATATSATANNQTRRYTACDACHRLKTRCDGQRPCGRCYRMRRPEQCLDRAPPPLGRKRRNKADKSDDVEEQSTTATPAPEGTSRGASGDSHGSGGGSAKGFDVVDANELVLFRDWQRKRQRRTLDEWQAALAGVDVFEDIQQAALTGTVNQQAIPRIPLRQYDETRVIRTAMYGLVPWLRHLLIQELGIPYPAPGLLPEILRQLDRPLCPACVHPGKPCPVCETISFRKPGHFDWGLWVQSALMYVSWLPRHVVVYSAPHLDALPMAALVVQVDDGCYGTGSLFPESFRELECPSQARIAAVIAEREAANFAERKLAQLESPDSISTGSSSSSPSVSSPPTPHAPTDLALPPPKDSSVVGACMSHEAPIVEASLLEVIEPVKYSYSDDATDATDYCLVPAREIPVPPMMRPSRYRCSMNKSMEKLLGFTPEDMRRRASVRGWQLLWRLVSPREAQQFLMNHWKAATGLITEWSMTVHLATKSNTVIRVMLWAKYATVDEQWAAITYFMAPLPVGPAGPHEPQFFS